MLFCSKTKLENFQNSMHSTLKYSALVLLAALTATAVFSASNSRSSAKLVVQNTSPATAGSIRGTGIVPGQVAGAATTDTIVKQAPKLLMPILGGLARLTKKPFGLYVTPENSPVSDDIFIGFHTGIDFETNANEQNSDVPITAACDGTALLKEWATGYGGVFVQSCNIDGEDVTVIYGHLNADRIEVQPGQVLTAGKLIGYLGQGYSHETDGRRKHLHFDIHKGSDIDIHGYVAKQEDLANWLDPVKYLE